MNTSTWVAICWRYMRMINWQNFWNNTNTRKVIFSVIFDYISRLTWITSSYKIIEFGWQCNFHIYRYQWTWLNLVSMESFQMTKYSTVLVKSSIKFWRPFHTLIDNKVDHPVRYLLKISLRNKQIDQLRLLG